MSLPVILKLFYSVMTVAVLSLMGFYVRGLTGGHSGGGRAKALFRVWIGLLVALAIGFHLLTALSVPWVHWEINRRHIEPDREIVIRVENYRFKLPEGGIRLHKGEVVKFTALSGDLTYGLGVFREDGTMEFQMQVVPGHSNEIIWTFSEPGRRSIRCTEYAGVQTWKMHVKDAIDVLPATMGRNSTPGPLMAANTLGREAVR